MVSDKRNIKRPGTPKTFPLKEGKINQAFTKTVSASSVNGFKKNRITRKRYLIPVVFFFLCFLLYGNTLFNGYAGDDEIVTSKNEYVLKGFSALKDIFDKGSLYGVDKNPSAQYRPLVLLNFMAEVSLFGLNPHISHFFNVLFFAITVVLLYYFLQKILKNYNPAIIISATLLFIFHPIHTEVIANIKSRDEILCLLFGLFSFYSILLYKEQKKNIYYFLSMASFFAALFCKENALTFLAIIPLLLYFFTTCPIKEISLKTIPFICLTGIYLFIRSRVLESITFTDKIIVMQNSLMSATNGWDRTATSFVLLGKYIYMLFIPYPLSWDYSYNQIPVVSWTNIKAILSIIVCLLLVGTMFWGLKRKSIYSFLIALFFITLFLSSNLIIKINWTFGERFLYDPSISFCVALPILTAKAMKFNPFQLEWKRRIYFSIPILCLLLIYTAIVIPRNADWKNNFTLSLSGISGSPNSERTHEALGLIYWDTAGVAKDTATKNHYYSLSYEEFKRAVEIYPKNPAVLNYLGVIHFNKSQFDSALYYFKKSFGADSNNLMAIKNIGASYQNEHKFTLAVHYDSIALKKDPGNKAILSSLGSIYNTLGIQFVGSNDIDKAEDEFNNAFRCDSNDANALGNLGVVYQRKGNSEKAKAFYIKSLSINPKIEIFRRNLQGLERKPE